MLLMLLAMPGAQAVFGGDLKVHSFSHPMPRFAVIEGRVVGPKGNGLTGRKIALLGDVFGHFQRSLICLTDDSGYYRCQVTIRGGKDSRVQIELADAGDWEAAYRLGPVVPLEDDSVDWYEMPLHIVGKRIDPDFSQNIGIGQKRNYQGRVVDDRGLPLESACMSLFYKAFWYRRFVTDVNGQWALPMYPGCSPTRLRLKHPTLENGYKACESAPVDWGGGATAGGWAETAALGTSGISIQ